MLKLFGAGCIMFAAIMFGFYQAAKYAKRPVQIRQWIHALQYLETEIVYGFTPLPEALKRISAKIQGPPSSILNRTADLLHERSGITARESWQQATNEHWEGTALKQSEKSTVLQLGMSLGTTDQQDQIKHLRLAVTQLQADEAEAKDEQLRYEKMWKSLGALGGALIVILLY